MEYFKIIASLLLIIAAVYMVLRLMKNKINSGKGFIQVIYYQPIGYKKGIGVVKAFDEYLLVGISENGINLISKLDSSKIKTIFEDNSEERKTVWQKIFKGGLLSLFVVLLPHFSFAAPQQPAGGGLFGFSSAVDLLVFITLLSFFASHTYNDDILYKNCYCSLFAKTGFRNTCSSPKSGNNRTCPFF